jgi:hypothetical protein
MSLAPVAIALNVLPRTSPFTREALVLASSKYSDDYNDDYDQSAEEYSGRTQRRYSPKDQGLPGLGGLLKNQRQLGAGLLGVGMLLTFMGMMLFFEGTLLRLGNVSPHGNSRDSLFRLPSVLKYRRHDTNRVLRCHFCNIRIMGVVPRSSFLSL